MSPDRAAVPTAKHFVHHDNADYDPVEFREFLDVAEFGAPPGRAGRNPLPIVVMDLVPTCADGVDLLGRAARLPGVALWITWESDVPEHLVDHFEVIDADVVLAKRGARHG